MEFNYRTADGADAEKLRNLGLISYGQFKEILGDHWKTMKANHEKMDYVNLLSFAHGFICESESEIVGMAFLVPSGHPTEIYSSTTSYIRLVGVNPKYSGNGIAKELTNKCIKAARHLGEKTVMLHTSEFMDAARHIYESIGFKRVKDLHKIFGKQYYLYELPLQSEI